MFSSIIIFTLPPSPGHWRKRRRHERDPVLGLARAGRRGRISGLRLKTRAFFDYRVFFGCSGFADNRLTNTCVVSYTYTYTISLYIYIYMYSERKDVNVLNTGVHTTDHNTFPRAEPFMDACYERARAALTGSRNQQVVVDNRATDRRRFSRAYCRHRRWTLSLSLSLQMPTTTHISVCTHNNIIIVVLNRGDARAVYGYSLLVGGWVGG